MDVGRSIVYSCRTRLSTFEHFHAVPNNLHLITITLFLSQAYLANKKKGLLIEETGNQIKSTQIKSNVGFWREGKTGVPGEEPLGAEQRTNKLNPHVTSDPGNERVISPLRQHCSQDLKVSVGFQCTV